MAVRYFQHFVFFLCFTLVIFAAPGVVRADDAPVAAAKSAGPPVNPKSPDELDLIDVGTVKEIKQTDIVTLDNGKTYHLDQIRVPVVYMNGALEYLQAHVLGKKVGVYAIKSAKVGATDRYGNLYGHLMTDSGTWVQADMVARGLAWAFSTENNRTLIHPLYKYEAAARAEKIGFWKDPEYVIKTKSNIAKYVNSFQIFQGVLIGGSYSGDRYVFMCDAGWNKPAAFNFTIRPDKTLLFKAPGARINEVFSTWRGVLVRVRGWVEKDPSGIPTIEVTHPEQMEFLNPTTGEPTTKD